MGRSGSSGFASNNFLYCTGCCDMRELELCVCVLKTEPDKYHSAEWYVIVSLKDYIVFTCSCQLGCFMASDNFSVQSLAKSQKIQQAKFDPDGQNG